LTKGGRGGEFMAPSVAPRAGFDAGNGSQNGNETPESPPPWFRGVIRKPGCSTCGGSVVHFGTCPEGGPPSPPDGGPVYLAFDAATGADVSFSFCPYCLRGDGRHLLECAGVRLAAALVGARGGV
jgi:hypothetical protein